eukprot:CFRG0297T1
MAEPLSQKHSFVRRQFSDEAQTSNITCEATAVADNNNLQLYSTFVEDAITYCSQSESSRIPSNIITTSAVPINLTGTAVISGQTTMCTKSTQRINEIEGVSLADTSTLTNAIQVNEFVNTNSEGIYQIFNVTGSTSTSLSIGPTNILNANNIQSYNGAASLPLEIQALFPNAPKEWLFNATNVYTEVVQITVTGSSQNLLIPPDCQVAPALFVDETAYGYIASTDLCVEGVFVCDYSTGGNVFEYYLANIDGVKTTDANSCLAQVGSVTVQPLPINSQVIVLEMSNACGGSVIAQQQDAGIQISQNLQFLQTTVGSNNIITTVTETATTTTEVLTTALDVTANSTRPTFGF